MVTEPELRLMKHGAGRRARAWDHANSNSGRVLSVLVKLPFWLLLIASAYLSLSPTPHPVLESYSDKLLHSAGYCALLLFLDMAHGRRLTRTAQVLLLLCYSFALEVGQHFIPGRFFSSLDVLANLFGLLLAAAMLAVLDSSAYVEKRGTRRP